MLGLAASVFGTPAQAQNPAQGAPAIVGEGIVGVTLSLDVTGITDGDGLPEASTFDYKWYHTDDSATVQGTASTYALTASDVGKKLRVVVGFMDLASNQEEVELASWPATGSIAPELTLSVSPTDLYEDGRVATVTVATAGGVNLDAAKTINLTLGGTATKDTDYTIASESLTIANGASSASTTITSTEDTVEDPDETVLISAATAANTAVGSQQTVTIKEPPALTLSVPATFTDTYQVEGNSVDVPFSLSGAPGREITIEIETRPDTGTSTSDFSTSSLNLTFGATETSKTMTFTVTDDSDVDPGESVVLDFDPNGLPSGITGPDDGVLTEIHLVDNDFQYIVTHADGTTLTVSEGAGTLSAQVSVRTPQFVTNDELEALDEDVVLSVSTANGTATAGNDYTALSSQTLTFTTVDFTVNQSCNCATAAKTVSVSITDDTVLEGTTPETFTLTLSHATGQRVTYPAPGETATVSITDNEQPSLTFSVAPTTIHENGGTATVTLATSDGNAIAADTVIALTLTGTATKGTDYSISSESLTLASGSSSVTATITATMDSTDDDNETVVVSAAVGGTAVGSAVTVTISENAAPTASNATVTMNEDEAYTFSASDFNFMDANSGDSLSSVSIESLPANGELELSSTAVTVGQSVAAADITNLVYLPPLDAFSNAIDPDSGDPIPGTAYTTFEFKVSDGTVESTDSYTLTIEVNNVDDPAYGTLSLSGVPRSGATVRLDYSEIMDTDGLPDVSEWDILWEYESGGSGEVGSSFLSENNTVYLVPGSDDGKTLKVKVEFTDNGGTPKQTFRVARWPAAGTITDNVAPVVANAIPDQSAAVGMEFSYQIPANAFTDAENDTLTYEATKADGSDLPTWLSFDAATRTFSGTPQATDAETLSIRVTVDDTYEEGTVSDEFDIVVSALSLTLSVSPTTIVENGGMATVTVATSDGSNATAAQSITLSLAGTATKGTDYSISSESLTLAAGSSEVTATITATMDSTDDDNETVVVSASSGGSAVGSAVTVTISENSAPTASNGTVTMDEDTTYTFSASDFSFMDTDTGDSLSSVKIESLPAAGSLTLSSVAVTVGQSVTAANITNLQFAPAANGFSNPLEETDNAYATFDFKVSDGTVESADSYTVTIEVNNVDDEHTGTLGISGEAIAGVTVRLDFSSLVEPDGLPPVSDMYMVWQASDNSSSTDGVGVDSYMLYSSEVGHTLAVDVEYTDLGGTKEVVTLAVWPATGAIDPALELSVSPTTIYEGGGTATVTVATQVGDALSTAKTVNLTLGGTATKGTDYSIDPETVTLASGTDDVSATATITAIADTATEGDETVEITAATAAGTALEYPPSNATPTVTITESAPTLSISVSPDAIAEAAGTATVTVSTGTGPTFGTDQTITLSVAGTATETDDYTISSKSLTLAAGETSVSATVTAVQDVYDDDGETVLITATHGGSTIGAEQTVTITDDDAAPAMSAVSVDNASIAEADGTSTVTVSTNGSAFTAAQTITLSVAGTATESDDYTISSKSLTLAAGEVSVTATVTAVQDEIDDDAETVLITATHNSATVGAEQTVTITDDDAAPSLTVGVSPATIAEAAGTSTLTVSTGSGSTFSTDQTITLTLAGTATESDDYTIDSKSLTLTAGETSTTATVTAVQDIIDDDAETVLITATHNSATVGAEQTVTITDDDAAPTLSVSVDSTSVAEAGGNFTVTVRTSGTAFSTDQTITLTLGGTATENTDYTIDSKSLTLPAGETSVTATVTATQDTTSDAGETVLVTAAHGGSTIGSQQSVTISESNAPTSSSKTVTMDEDGMYTFGASDFSFMDADTGDTLSSITIKSLPADGSLALSGVAVTVDQSVPAADIASLAFTPVANEFSNIIGETGTAYAMFDFKVSDGTVESTDSYTVTIEVNNENDDPTGALSISGVPRTGATVTLDISQIMDADGLPGVADWDIRWEYEDGSGNPDTDNLSENNTVYTVEANDADKAFRVVVEYADNGGTDKEEVTLARWPATGTIVRNSPPVVDNAIPNQSASVGVAFSYQVPANTFSDADTDTLTYEATKADDTALPTWLSFDPATRTFSGTPQATDAETLSIKVKADDSYEGGGVTDEFDILVSELSLTFSVSPTMIEENGGTATVTVATSDDSNIAADAVITLTLEGTATKDTDYSISSESLTLAAGTSEVTATITATMDTTDDDNETVLISAASDGSAIGSQLTVTITESDPTLSISVSSDTIAEAAGTSTVTVSTDAGATFATDQTITLELAGTATETDDYTIDSKSLTLTAGQTSVTATVTAVQDFYDDDDETVLITAMHDNNTIGAQQTVTITDDDDAPAMSTVSVDNASIAEAAGTSTVTVSTNGSAFAADQTITLSVAGTATETDDYTIASKSLTLTAGEITVTTTVTAVQDDIDDDDETVLITVTHSGATFGAEQTVTITDDDDAPVLTVSVSPDAIAEAAGTSTVTVSTGTGSTFTTDETITLSVAGTATETDDYTIASKSLTLTAGATSVTTTVTAVQDNYDDDAETVLITAMHDGDTVGAEQTVTITDDDDAPVLTVSVTSDTIAEAAGASTVTVSTGTGSTFATDQTVTLTLAGTATETDDFTIASKSLTLPAGVGAAASSVTTGITAVQDSIDEDNETILIDAARVTGASTSVAVGSRLTVTVTDDDDAPVLLFEVDETAIGEAAEVATLTVRTGTGSTFVDSQTINLALHADGTAALTDDFTLASTSLTLPAGSGTAQSSITTTITAVQDRIDEDDETIVIDAARVTGASTSVAVGSQLTVTVTDDDAAPVLLFEVDNTAIGEAAEVATLTVRTGTGSTFVDSQTINLALHADGTATLTDDFTIASTSLTLPAGSGTAQSSITATITAVQDNIDEENETILIAASRVTGADTSVAVGSQLTVTVTDDDAAPVLALDVSSASISEAAGTSTVTVSTGTGSTFATDQTITLTLGGSATETDDFTIGSKSLTLPAGVGTGDSEITTTITAADDDFFEGTTNEQLTVSGSRAGTAFGATRTVTIEENEDPPKLALTLTDSSISENGGSTTVTASVSPRTVDAFTATFSVTPNLPATSADYTLTGSLSFAALSATATGTVTIAANNNRVDRPDKTVSVSASSSQTYFRATDAVELTIEDEDDAPAPVLEVSVASIAENAGTSTVTVTTGDGSTFPQDMTVTLTVTGAATENTDYTITSKSLTLPAGSGLDVSSVNTTVTGIDDIIDDDAEDILVDAAIGAAAVGAQQTITVTDDDAAPVLAVTVSDASIAENGGTSTVTVTTGTGSTFAADQAITLSLSGTATEPGDYSLDTTLTLPAGVGVNAASVDATITGVDDIIDDDDETILIDASRAGADFGSRQTVTITDDDAAPVLVFTAQPASISENGGVSTLTVGTGTGSTYATDQTITLAAEGTAIEDADYTIASKTLTLPAGVGSNAASITTTVTGLDDGFFEGDDDQTAIVTATHDGATVGTQTVAVVDDEANSQVTLTLTPDSVGEAETAVNSSQITASVSPPAEHAFSVSLQVDPVAPATAADFTTALPVPPLGLLDFAAQATESTGLAFIHPVDNDVDAPDKTLTVSGSITGFDPDTLTVQPAATTGIRAPADVTLTITDDDEAEDTVTLSLDVTSVAEDAGATPIEVTATLDTGARESDVAVALTVSSGTGETGAESGVDFGEVEAFTITIEAGSTSASAGFSLTPLEDSIDEPDEVLLVGGSTEDPLVGVPGTAEITITDNDDVPALTLEVDPASIAENGGEATVTVSTGTGSTFADEQTVELTVSGTATTGTDYTISSQTLTLPAGAGTEPSTVTATVTGLDDNLDDDAETVVIGALFDGEAFGAEQTVTIEDDDGTPQVTLVLTPPSISEDGGASTVTATVSPASATAFTVTVASAPVSPAVAGDFTQSGSTLSFGAGATASTGTVTIGAVDNSADTPDRQVAVSGTVSSAGVGAPAGATLTILDDDTAAVLALQVAPSTIAEDGGTATVTVTTGTGSTFDTAQAITLVLEGTATQDEDYSISATELTLPAGAASVTATLTGLDDTVFEGEETILIAGELDGEPFGAEATLTITDDETAPAVTLVLTPDSIEEDGGTATVTATVSAASAEPFTVTVAVEPDAPAVPEDFVLAGETLSFAANATESTGEVTITAVNNDVDAPDKTLRVSGTVSREDVTAPPEATLTILDDDEASSTVTLSVTPEQIGEGAPATQIEVTGMLDSGARNAETVISLSLGGGESAASPGVDYESVADFNLTIPANETSATATFTLTPLEDRIDEADEAVTLTGSAVTAGIGVPETVAIAIADNDDAPVLAIGVEPVTIPENGGTATVTVTTGQGSTFADERTIALSVSGTATQDEDYRLQSTTLTLPAGTGNEASTATVAVTALDDGLVEDAETVLIDATLDGAAIGTQQTLTIENDDESPTPSVTLVLSPASINESGGVSTVTARLSSASAEAFTVTVSAAAVGPAVAGDFTLAGTTLTFEADATESSGEVTITAVDNDEDTPDKTVTVSGAVSLESVIAPADATLTIEDDDEPPTPSVTLVLSPASIDENGGVSTVTATVTPASAEAFTVTVSAAAVDPAVAGDFALTGTTLSFAAAATESTGEVTITAVDNDEDAPDKTVTVSGAVSVEGVSAPANATLTIEDDDEAVVEPPPPVETPVVTLVLAPASIGENGGVSTVTATVTPASDEAFTVSVSAAAVDPAVADDFTLTGTTLSFAAAATESTGEVSITAVNNDEDAPDKTVTVSGAVSVEGVSAPADATLTILDDDEAPPPPPVRRGVTVSPTELTVGEGDETGATYRVSLIAEPTGDVTFTVLAPPGGGVAVDPARFTIAAADWEAGQTVTVTAGEDDDADDQTVTLSHSATGAGYNDVAVSAVTVTVLDRIDPGQPDLSIADARGMEADGQLLFDLTLDRPAAQAVSIDYATRDGTARAGEDYEAGTGTATIRAGEDSAQIAVALRMDLFSEPDETFVVTLTRAEGARLADTQATGTIEDEAGDGAASKQWLSRFGRIAGGHVMTAIGDQIAVNRVGGTQVTVAGSRLTGAGASGVFGADAANLDRYGQGGFGLAPSGGWGADPSLSAAGRDWRAQPGERPWNANGGLSGAGGGGYGTAGYGNNTGYGSSAGYGNTAGNGFASAGSRTMSGRELLANSAFLLNAGPGGGSGVSVWGRGNYTRFDNLGEGLQAGGDAVSATLGVDWACARCLLGIALSHTSVDATYGNSGQDAGDLKSTVTGLYPYFGAQLTERFSVWGLVGQGQGELIATPAGSARAVEVDLETSVTGLGARGELLAADNGFSLAVKTDALVSRTSTGAADGILEAEGEYRRVRLGLEGAWLRGLGEKSSLRTSLEVAAREDAGEDHNGLGVEVGGGFEFIGVAPGLSLDVAVRGLVSHQAEDYEEWSVSGGFRYDPDPGTAAGPLVSLTHSWGPAGSGGLQQALWRNDLSRTRTPPQTPTTMQGSRTDLLSAEFAYGFKAFGALGIPWARLGTTGAGEEYRLGYSLLTHRGIPSLELARSAFRSEYRMGWEFSLRCRAQVAVQVLHTADPAGERADTGFEIRFRSIPRRGPQGGSACETQQSLFSIGAPR